MSKAPRTGRPCTVCTHGERTAIDKALVRGTAFRRIAKDYGLSEAAVRRHANNHVPKLLEDAAGAAAEEERITAAGWLAGLVKLYEQTSAILERNNKKDDAIALRAVSELRQIAAVGLRGVETAELEERIDALEEALTTKNRRAG